MPADLHLPHVDSPGRVPAGGHGVGCVSAPVRVVAAATPAPSGWHSRGQVSVSPEEAVFAGHFPDLPVFPGVCVIDCVHRVAQATSPADHGTLALAAVESARFLAPVRPGDTLDISLSWPAEDALVCQAEVTTADRPVAVIRLRLAGSR